MDNATASAHQVDLTRADHLLAAQAVAVQELALNHPGEGLQRRMRVSADMQAFGALEPDRPDMVEKTPGPNHAALAGGQGATYRQALAELG